MDFRFLSNQSPAISLARRLRQSPPITQWPCIHGRESDVGATPAGFADNMVIGHLKLSRQSPNAVLHFTGAGAQNGMYVDYLELDTNSLSYNDYREGLVIDPNLTIYFAACNVDPVKLETVYTNRLVWVPGFAGPNSTVAVPYLGSTNVCLMNLNVATSPDMSFFPPVPNADNQPYVLNDPSNPTNFISCPTDMTLLRALSSAALLQRFQYSQQFRAQTSALSFPPWATARFRLFSSKAKSWNGQENTP